jgi:hypothetical protein
MPLNPKFHKARTEAGEIILNSIAVLTVAVIIGELVVVWFTGGADGIGERCRMDIIGVSCTSRHRFCCWELFDSRN